MKSSKLHIIIVLSLFHLSLFAYQPSIKEHLKLKWEAHNEIKSIYEVVNLYKKVNGKYPTKKEDLKSIIRNENKEPEWGLLSDDIIDPWGNEYIYQNPSVHIKDYPFEIYSKGPDGISKSNGNDQDDITIIWKYGDVYNKSSDRLGIIIIFIIISIFCLEFLKRKFLKKKWQRYVIYIIYSILIFGCVFLSLFYLPMFN